MNEYFSQFGEDRFLEQVFAGKTQGFCIEVGANDGVNDSTSYFFEKKGWHCLLVEPNPALCESIRATRRAELHECALSDRDGSVVLHVAEGAERSHGLSTICATPEALENISAHGFTTRGLVVRKTTLNALLGNGAARPPIDFISVDVEGHELNVLRGFDLARWNPRILLLEDNSNFRDSSVCDYLERQGYVRFKRTGVNDWYACKEDRELVNADNLSSYRALRRKTIIKDAVKRLLEVIPGGQYLKSSIVRIRSGN